VRRLRSPLATFLPPSNTGETWAGLGAAARCLRVITVADDYLMVGRVERPHGLRGRLRVQLFSRESELVPGATVYLSQGAAAPAGGPRRVKSVAPSKGAAVLITLAGVDTPEAAEALRHATVWMVRQDLPSLEAGAYYVVDLIGLRVETVAGKVLGELVDVLETGAADVYVVRGEAGETLLPATREVVREVDVAAGRIVVEPLPGMVE